MHRTCHLAIARVVALGVLAALTACTSTTPAAAEDGQRDYLTDVDDDGSLALGAFRSDPTTRLVALRALSRLSPGDAQDLLLKLPGDTTDAAVLSEFCFTLGSWGEPSSGPVLVELATHGNSRVRAAALDALGRLGDDRRTALVTAAMADSASDVRGAAALTLFRLDGRRYDHVRRTTEKELVARDAALAEAALHDPNPGVRWRATYALAEIRGRPGLDAILAQALEDESAALVRVFALRGLVALQDEELADAATLARPLLQDPDPRVAIEAARAVVAVGPPDEVQQIAAGHPSAHIRRLAWEALPAAAARAVESGGAVPDPRDIEGRSADEVSPMVRREALAAAAAIADLGGADPSPWLATLVGSSDWRDRERAAQLLAADVVADEWLDRLLADPVAAVRAAAIVALGDERLVIREEVLMAELGSSDPAVRTAAAMAAATRIEEGRARPELVGAVADALEATEGFEMEEARVALAAALGLPPVDSGEELQPPPGKLLERRLAEHQAAMADPQPRVLLSTNRGDIELALDRVAAPVHVESFLELAETGFYDGLDFHRVVPNFVVQGLDPRGDGWGVGDTRLPAEFSRTPFLSGTLGMPRTETPHTGGCQIFITHVPTPHLDGRYTAFGRVTDGMDVVAAIEVGDVIESVRRIDVGTGVATAN